MHIVVAALRGLSKHDELGKRLYGVGYLLVGMLGELHGRWAFLLGEPNVTWGLRSMKTLWGSCNWRKRHVTYNLDLAREPRELIEYVVVHELTHLRAHDHGPAFQSLMDVRLPDWRLRRRGVRHVGG